MAVTKAILVDQISNGTVLRITDTTNWTDTSDTGVTNITINITYGDDTVEVVNTDYGSPPAQNELVFDITWATEFSVDVPVDGKIDIDYVITGGEGAGTLSKDILLDYNSKLWEFTKYKDMPYSFKDGNPAYNTDVQDAALASVLVLGMQYNAGVGQTDKMDFILDMINNLIDE